MRRFATILLALMLSFSALAESVDSLVVKPKSQYPVFGMWRNSYFATGASLDRPLSQYSADVKFQLSLGLRLWNIKGKADILATYTQRSIWDIYQKSCPFRETAYNPGVWADWQVNNKVRMLFGFEHESNGLSGENSRSLNYLTAACIYEPTPHWILGARAWYGYFFHNEDIYQGYFRYRGVMHLWATFRTLDDRIAVTALVNPTVTFAKYNVQVEASWRMAKRGDWLPCLFVQYNYGYGETMIDYNKRHSKIRIGISLMNNRLNLY
jgi:phospholipase A1